MKKTIIENNLIRKVLSGNKNAEKIFVDLCIPCIWGALARFDQLTFDDKQDIQQRIFYKLYNHDKKVIRAFKGDSSFTTYLWMIISREALDYIRSTKHFSELEDDSIKCDSLDGDQNNKLSVNDAIKTLKEIEQKIVRMDMKRFKERDIAKELDIPIGTVASHKKRARNKMKNYLKEKSDKNRLKH